MPDTSANKISYALWSDVPDELLTMSQHPDLDPPRIPAPDYVATVQGRNFKGKEEVFKLYDVTESVPTRTGPVRLSASPVHESPAQPDPAKPAP
jgi:hypothetical protein